MDEFLNNYCASATFTNTAKIIVIPTTVIRELVSFKTVISTVTRTVSPTRTHSPTISAIHRQHAPSCTKPSTIFITDDGITIPAPSIVNQSELEREANTPLVIVLGSLLGLSVLLLAAVTIGWVHTCWAMRKRQAETSKK